MTLFRKIFACVLVLAAAVVASRSEEALKHKREDGLLPETVSLPNVQRAPKLWLGRIPEQSVAHTDEVSQKGEVVREFAADFMVRKGNIYFEPNVLVQDLLARENDAVQILTEMLQNAPTVPSDDAEVMERIAALDLLALMAAPEATSDFGVGTQQSAKAALIELCLARLPAEASVEQRRAMVAEKYDAFIALTHSDSATAFAAYHALPSDNQRAIMAPALMTALIEQGVSRIAMDTAFATRVNDARSAVGRN